MEAANNSFAFTLTITQLEALISECIHKALSGTIKTEDKKSESYYSRKEAADMLKMSVVTLDRYLKMGIIKKHRVGNRILISDSEIKEALKRNET